MRRRSTFIQPENTDFDPGSIKITEDSLFIPELKAAREEQLKYSLDELPEELQQLLVNSQELHVRWSSDHRYETVAPYLSRTTPGLHVFYTGTDKGTDDLLCPTLRRRFSPELECRTPNATFIRLDILESEFKTSPALHYHSLLPNLDHLVTYLQRTVCPHSSLSCIHSTSLLATADTFDISWSAIASTLTVSAFWSRPPGNLIDPTTSHKSINAWSLSIPETSSSSASRVEVGILSSESTTSDPLDLTLSGFLIVPGTDTAPKPTRFTFPSRHHRAPSPQRYSASVAQPQGLHPTLLIAFPNPAELISPEPQCTLQAHLTLPSHTFIDPYALKPSDPNFVSTYHISNIHSHTGYLDLEAPDYLPSTPWGSTLLFTPTLPSPSAHDASWVVSIPLHLRYLPPSSLQSHTEVLLPYPVLYWACPSPADSATKFPVSPFDRLHLGYDSAYGPLTSFWHLDPIGVNISTSTPAEGKLTLPLSVPVLHTEGLTASPIVIEVVTLLTILCGFLWVFLKLWPGLKEELASYIPETTETTVESSAVEWREPVKGGGIPARREQAASGKEGEGVRRRG